MTSLPAFSLDRVSYCYASVRALDSISLDIPAGQHTALLGSNGSGKSTLLRLLDALSFPQSGSISFLGHALHADAFAAEEFALDFRRRVGLVFQNPEVQLFNPTVLDEVAFGPSQLRWAKAEILDRVDQMLERIEISHLKHRSPHQLSGGEKKRVALASVLVLNPEVLLLDEPTAALDPRSESRMIDLLASLTEDTTIITATHDLTLAAELAGHCFVLSDGTLSAAGRTASILKDSDLLERVNLVHTWPRRPAPV